MAESRCCGTGHGLFSYHWWNSVLVFHMPKVVVLQIWQVGLVHKIMMAGVAAYIAWQIVWNDSWAYTERPEHRINGYADAGEPIDYAAPRVYCNNASYSYTFSSTFSYSDPICEEFGVHEIAQKMPQGTVAFTTVFRETTETGWPCDATDASTKAATCIAAGGALSTRSSTQCLCTEARTVFPIGVESMLYSFEHAFVTTTRVGDLNGFSGYSGEDVSKKLGTDLVTSNGTTLRTFAPGSTVSMSVAEWLAAAGTPDGLDSLNPNATEDAVVPGRQPFYRTTGYTVHIYLDYTNIPRGHDRPPAINPQVYAKMTVDGDTFGWAGFGVRDPIYEQLPSGPPNRRTFRKVIRYSQGVVFQIEGRGVVYQIDTLTLINIIITSFVLFGVANTMTRFFAQWVFSSRQMIRNRTREKFAIGNRLVEIGIKAVSYANIYNGLAGPAHQGEPVSASDIDMALESTGWEITPHERQAIADLIVKYSQIGEQQEDGAHNTIDFPEFVMAMEAGSMIHLNKYKREALQYAKARGYIDRDTPVGEAWAGAENSIMSKVKSTSRQAVKVTPRSEPIPEAGSGGPA